MFNYKENDELFVVPMSYGVVEPTSSQAKAAAASDKIPDIVNRYFTTKTKVNRYTLSPDDTRAFLKRWHTYLDKGEYKWSNYKEGKSSRTVRRCGIPISEALYFMTELNLKELYDLMWEWVDEGAAEVAFCMYDI